MKNLFSIGEVSKYQNISKQTLIYYDKIGLFRPAYVDPDNGYRYYSPKQIDYLDTILIMKKIGFSLNEIKEHMQNYNIDSSLTAFRKQLSVIDQKIQELNLIRSRVTHRCDQMECSKIYRQKEDTVVLEDMEDQYILFREVEKPYTLREISIATKQCFSDSFQNQLPIFLRAAWWFPFNVLTKAVLQKLHWLFCLLRRRIKRAILKNCLLVNVQVFIISETICLSAGPMKSCWIIAGLTAWKLYLTLMSFVLMTILHPTMKRNI